MLTTDAIGVQRGRRVLRASVASWREWMWSLGLWEMQDVQRQRAGRGDQGKEQPGREGEEGHPQGRVPLREKGERVREDPGSQVLIS